MRYFSGLFIFPILAVICLSCSNELNISGNADPIPVVYCLLNPDKDVQYIRIGKSFTSSTDLTDDNITYDSITWNTDLEIYVERWGIDNSYELLVFDRSDFSHRDTGLFPTERLTVYEANFKPVQGDEYHLFVYFPELNKIVSGKTVVMSIPEVLDPDNVPGRTISFDTISPYYIRWSGGDYPGVYQGVFKMNYSEQLNGNFEYKSCNFNTPIFFKQTDNEIFEERINELNFFKSVSEQVIPVDGIIREIINFEFIFYAGGQDMAMIIKGDLDGGNPFSFVLNNSNISGGTGIFSSIIIQGIPNLKPSASTRYFLATSNLTKNLGFTSEGL